MEREGFSRATTSAGALTPRLKQLGDEARPASLVRRAEASSGVTVEVLVKQDVIAEVRIALQERIAPEHRTASTPIAYEDARQSASQLRRHLVDRQVATRAGGALDSEVVAVVVVELLERLDDQIVHRHPDRTAPVRVAT